MNQTTWIVGGGAVIVALAAVLFVMSGTDKNTVATTGDNKDIAITRIDEASTSASAQAAAVALTTMPEDKTTETAPDPAVALKTAQDTVTLKTSMGDITVKLYTKDAPKTVENFLKLASAGFYDGVKFHRVIKGFMIQGGDPQSKDDSLSARWGSGGPGYKFDDEIDAQNAVYQRGYRHGVLAMANSGPNTNGSQFFIMASDYPLPPLYTIFGEVVEGLSVVDAIDAVQTDVNDMPLTPVVVEKATVR
jgi:cyclophilin family peptidyl-prolyl cis-trans isomerase